MGFDSFDNDEYCAERLQTAFRQFVWEFLEEDAGATCRELLNSETARFKGGYVGQKPEEFTQRTIVEEVLKALGYEIRHHPVDLVKSELKQPDIELRNLSDQCVGIVECKALNRERNNGAAIEDLHTPYFKDNTFAKIKKELDLQYLVGIATDGFDWKIRIKNLETGEMRQESNANYSLVDDSDGIHHCFYSEVHEETKTVWPQIREELAENFVANFGIHNLP